MIRVGLRTAFGGWVTKIAIALCFFIVIVWIGVLYLFAAAILGLGVAAFNVDMVTAFSGVVQALGNVGPGLGQDRRSKKLLDRGQHVGGLAQLFELLAQARMWAERLGKPVRLWMSDKQDAFVRGIAAELPAQFHLLLAQHPAALGSPARKRHGAADQVHHGAAPEIEPDQDRQQGPDGAAGQDESPAPPEDRPQPRREPRGLRHPARADRGRRHHQGRPLGGARRRADPRSRCGPARPSRNRGCARRPPRGSVR